MKITETMNNIKEFFTLDHLVVYIFLVVIAVVGWYVGRKNKDITEYAIANKMFGILVLTITLLATYVGGAMTVGNAANVFSDGIIITLVASSCIPMLLTALLIAPKVNNLKGCITMGDVMGKFYGERGRITTGVIGTIYSLIIIASQTVAMGHVGHALLGMKASTGMIVSGAIMVFYSFYGGVKSVTITDVIQFAVLIFMIPAIAFVATDHVGGVGALMNKVPAEKFVIFGHEKFYYYVVVFIVWGVFPISALSPPMVQRVLMGQDKEQVRRGFLIGAAFMPFFAIMMMFIGLSALVSAPEIEANLALPHLVNELFSAGIKGLVVAGLLAVAMSTGDSYLNAGGILLTHDVVKPIYDKKKKVINELKITKYLTLVMGVISIFLGLLSDNVVKIGIWAATLFGSTITLPFIAGVLGLKTDAKSFFTALGVAVITFVVANLYLENERVYLAPLLSIIANGVSFFGMHFVQHSGLVVVRRKGRRMVDEKVTWESIVTKCKSFLPTKRSITSFSKRRVERYGANHLLFGVFFSLNYIVPYFMWTPEKSPYFTTIMSLRAIGGMLCVGLLTEDYWPKWAKRFFPTYWHVSVLYCLPFVSTFMLFLLGGAESMEWIINLSLAIVVTASLVDWVSFIVLMVLGVAGGYGFFTLFSHKYLGGIAPLANMPGIYIQILIYSSLFATLLGLVFLRKKEKKTRSQLKSMENFAGAIVHEVSNVVGLSQMYASALQNFMTEIKEKTTKKGKKLYILDENTHNGIKEIVETLERDCKKGLTIMRRMIVTLEPEIKPEDTDVYSIGRCVKEAIEGYDMEDFQEERVHIDIREDFKFRGSKYYLIHALYQLIKNVHKHAGVECEIEIWTEDYKLHFRDNGRGISKEKLSHIFEHFYSIDKSGTGVGLAFCKLVMDTFGGSISCETEKGKYTEFILSFPKEKVKELPEEDADKEEE